MRVIKYVSDFLKRRRLVVCLLALTLSSCFSQTGYCEAAAGEDNIGSFLQVFPERANEISFGQQKCRFLRFNIFSSGQGAPAIDELLVYESKDATDNLAATNLKSVTASSCITGYDIHRVENIVDDKFGNNASWVAGDDPSFDVPQWVQLEWNSAVTVGKVIFSRDRAGLYHDRLPLELTVELSNDGENWSQVAVIHGVTTDISASGLAEYTTQWFANAPQSPAKDFVKVNASIGGNLSEYQKLLQEAFLGEENALLKISGFADCEQGLIQRHYPEFVEPKHKPDSIVPLPELEESPSLNFSSFSLLLDPTWENASRANVYGFAGGNFSVGPLVEQTISAAIVDDLLFVRIEGNRFLSDHRAMISTENLPVRGFLCVRDNRVFWKQIDSLGDRKAESEFELQGKYNSTTGELKAAIPLAFFPEYERRGLYISLGIGCHNTLPGGRPVHFKIASFSARLENNGRADDDFVLRINAFHRGLRLKTNQSDVVIQPNESKELHCRGNFGQTGAEIEWECVDTETGDVFRFVQFRYDSCYRPFCQLKEMLERLEGDADDRFDERDFDKRRLIPGSINPRYVNLDLLVNEQDNALERRNLFEYFGNQSSRNLEDDSVYFTIKRQAIILWKEYNEILKNSKKIDFNDLSSCNEFCLRERELFYKVRLLKRELFLSNDELNRVEHILANKRRPFWPSHNYSDLFDSEWNPGGGVVMIDIPREAGVLRPEKSAIKEIVNAKDGIIRNPSASFDATKIYYSFRASQNEYYRIFELDLATGVSRRISADGPFHDFWPTELPDGDLAFISTRCKKKFICWRPQAFVLFRMNKNGGNIKPLSFANLTEFAPSVEDDGRIIWTRSEYVDKGADYGHTLWTIRTDGTSPELVFGNTINLPQGYANGRRVPNSNEVCCVMISHFGDLNGPVALLDLSKGPHDPSAICSITPEVPWPGFWARTETFREPFPISRDVFLVSHAAFDRFGIYLIDRFGNREMLAIDPTIDVVCPQPFEPRDVPPVIENPGEPELKSQKLGRFSIANVYRGLEGQVRPGEAKYLRVCQEMPSPLALLEDGTYQADHDPFMEYYASPVDVLQGAYGWTSYVAKGVLGTVKIEEDGSSDFLAPAEKVLFFELLDENYNEIQRMRSVVQLQAGERRSCIGCHESRLSTPEGGLTNASKKASQQLVPPPWGAGAFWYEKVVQPVLNNNCAACHNNETATQNPRQFDLTETRDENKIPRSYRSLIQSGDVHYFDYTWGGGKTTKADPYTFGTAKSKIWSILKDENHRSVLLKSEEEQALKCWIDLNLPLWGDYQQRSLRE